MTLTLYRPEFWDDLLDFMVTLGCVMGRYQFGVMAFGFGFWLTNEDPQ